MKLLLNMIFDKDSDSSFHSISGMESEEIESKQSTTKSLATASTSTPVTANKPTTLKRQNSSKAFKYKTLLQAVLIILLLFCALNIAHNSVKMITNLQVCDPFN